MKNQPILLALAMLSLQPWCAAQCLERERLLAPAGQPGDQLGSSLAVEGSLVVVGAQATAHPGMISSGSAHLFRLGSAWTHEAELESASASLGAQLGCAVALDGRRVLTGARLEFVAGLRAGAAHVFEEGGGGWVEAARLVASDGAAEDRFGSAVALAGEAALVGARLAGPASSGAVYVFERAGGAWPQTQKLTASDAMPFDSFGASLALDGELLAVGAPGWDLPGGPESVGVVYLFERVGGVWQEVAQLRSPAVAPLAFFGASLALEGQRLAVGASGLGGGMAFVFERQPGGSWLELLSLSDPAGATGDGFGLAVALSGERVLVGSPSAAEGSVPAAGRALLFRLDGSLLASFRSRSLRPADQFGSSVALTPWAAFVGELNDLGPDGEAGSLHAFSLPTLVERACLCAASAPCSNPDPEAGCANSAAPSAQGGRLSSCGSTSVAEDDLVLTAAGLPPFEMGLVFLGEGAAPPFLHGDGLRCVVSAAGGPWRYPVRHADADGVLFEGPGLVEAGLAQLPPAAHIAAGETWYWQAWYRDLAGPCGQGFNLTNALAVQYAP